MDHGICEVTLKEKRRMGKTTDDGGERIAEAVPVPEGARAPAGAKPTEVARVRYALGVTLNVGDYRSIRVDVQVEMPCRVSKDAIDLTHAFAKEWAERKINGEIEDWTGDTAVKYLPESPEAPKGKRK